MFVLICVEGMPFAFNFKADLWTEIPLQGKISIEKKKELSRGKITPLIIVSHWKFRRPKLRINHMGNDVVSDVDSDVV